MNQDFHYNATYFAAKLAGYTAEEALTIASAAQFVDDCIPEVMPQNGYVNQIPTCEDASKLFDHFVGPAPYKIPDIMARRRIWSYFHFLPGNFDNRVKYEGMQTKTAASGEKWSFEYAGAEAFKLMSLPRSEMAKKMIDDLIDKVPRVSNPLELIGLRMHVLADTWAHSYFSGSPDQCVNDVLHAEAMYDVVDGNKNKISYVETLGDKFADDNPSKHFYGVVLIDSPRFVSPVYVGHGRAGHLPDYAYCEYSYVPAWKDSLQGDSRYHTKKNQEIFLQAFKQLVAVMKAIRANSLYDMDKDEDVIRLEVENDIKRILAVRKIDISSEWNELIQKYFNHVPRAYDKDAWINDYKTKVSSNDGAAAQSHYVKFTEAARNHYDWVEPLINEKLKIETKAFTFSSTGEFDRALNSGLVKPGEALLTYVNGQEKAFSAGILPGIESIQPLRSENYQTNEIYENEMKKKFEYVVLVRGGCPKGCASTSLQFKDRAGDVYDLSLVSSEFKNHTMFYNSTNPEIVNISLHINNSIIDVVSSEGGKVIETATEIGEQVLKAGEQASKKVVDNVSAAADNAAALGEGVGKVVVNTVNSVVSKIGKWFGRG